MADTYYTFKDFSGEAINELLKSISTGGDIRTNVQSNTEFIAALKNNEINIVVNGGTY